MSYAIVITPKAQRQIRKLSISVQVRVVHGIRQLEANPRPDGCIKLSGMENTYRIREGAYRVIYQIRDKQLLVLVLELGHRREIYR